MGKATKIIVFPHIFLKLSDSYRITMILPEEMKSPALNVK
jgi:hypothetical protein